MRTLFRWKNCIEPCLTRNKPATKIEMDKLAEDVKNYPDDSLEERAAHFKVSSSGIGYVLKRLDISYKKTLEHPKADEKAQAEFKKTIQDSDFSIRSGTSDKQDVLFTFRST